MVSYSEERRARFVMFLGLAMLSILFIFGRELKDGLDYHSAWIIEDGWMHGLAAVLVLLGAWKWLNAREEFQRAEVPLRPGERRDELLDHVVAMGKRFRAESAREAAEMVMGRVLTNAEWAKIAPAWEAKWTEVE